MKYLIYTLIAVIFGVTLSNANGIPLLLLNNSPLRFTTPRTDTTSQVGKALLDIINSASSSIDFALYGIRDQDEIISALLNANARGVKIRGVIDKDVNDENYYTSTEELVKNIANIRTDFQKDKETAANQKKFNWQPYCDEIEGFDGPLQCVGYRLPNNYCLVASHASREPLIFSGDIMHNKFFIIDKNTVWTGSTNASDSGTGGYNANTAVVIKNKEVAMLYGYEFDQMYEKGLFHRGKKRNKSSPKSIVLSDGSTVTVLFSPQDYSVEKHLRPLIKNAKKYIDIPVFFLTHKKLAGDLIAADQRGVSVRIIIDATAAKNGYTKHEVLRAAGIPVKVENWGGKMHMKVAVIDGEFLVTGSMNWTSAGERNNDENTLIIASSIQAEIMHTFFNELWDSIPAQWLTKNPDPESMDSGNACFDGVDNDFDNLTDSEDPGCSANPTKLLSLPPYRIIPRTAGNNLVKGNISSKGHKIYQVPNSKYYDRTKIDISRGEDWFCSVYDAREAGWKTYKEY